ncbi:MAG: hypothetical protein ACLP5H_20600 [Desulfomonilaceae bacterium]
MKKTERRKIKAKEFVEDLRSGMTDESLMGKYAVSSEQFQELLRMAVDSGLISEEELHERLSVSNTAVTKAFLELQEAAQRLRRISEDDTV